MLRNRTRSIIAQTAVMAPFWTVTAIIMSNKDSAGKMWHHVRRMILFRTSSVFWKPVLCRL